MSSRDRDTASSRATEQQAYDQPPGYGQPPQGYAQPQGYGQMQPYGGHGPIGKVRCTGICILLFIVTLGIYGWYCYYKTHEEMKQHSGDGLGGGVALILAIFVGIVLPYTMGNEVGKSLRARRPAGAGQCGDRALVLPRHADPRRADHLVREDQRRAEPLLGEPRRAAVTGAPSR